MSNQVSEDGARRLKRIGFLFNMVFIAEGLLIGISIAICNLINQTDLIPGVIAIIVGIHFLPLAALFQIKVYYATGVLFCLLAFITWLVCQTPSWLKSIKSLHRYHCSALDAR